MILIGVVWGWVYEKINTKSADNDLSVWVRRSSNRRPDKQHTQSETSSIKRKSKKRIRNDSEIQ